MNLEAYLSHMTRTIAIDNAKADQVTPWAVTCQAPPSMGFSRQECWSGLPLSSPGDLPYPGIEPRSLASPALTGTTWRPDPPCQVAD